MFVGKPYCTTFMSNNKELFEPINQKIDVDSYNEVIRKLLYITSSIPNIYFFVHY